MDLVRDILIWASHAGVEQHKPKTTELKLAYHVDMMIKAGLIEPAGSEGYFIRTPGTDEWDCNTFVSRPTWEGCEFLKSIEKETVWAKVKEISGEHGLPVVMSVVKTLLSELAKQALIRAATGQMGLC